MIKHAVLAGVLGLSVVLLGAFVAAVNTFNPKPPEPEPIVVTEIVEKTKALVIPALEMTSYKVIYTDLKEVGFERKKLGVIDTSGKICYQYTVTISLGIKSPPAFSVIGDRLEVYLPDIEVISVSPPRGVQRRYVTLNNKWIENTVPLDIIQEALTVDEEQLTKIIYNDPDVINPARENLIYLFRGMLKAANPELKEIVFPVG